MINDFQTTFKTLNVIDQSFEFQHVSFRLVVSFIELFFGVICLIIFLHLSFAFTSISAANLQESMILEHVQFILNDGQMKIYRPYFDCWQNHRI